MNWKLVALLSLLILSLSFEATRAAAEDDDMSINDDDDDDSNGAEFDDPKEDDLPPISPPATPTKPVKKEKVPYVKPEPQGDYHFVDTFETNLLGSKWIVSKAKKDGVDEAIAKYEGEWSIEASGDAVFDGDKGLVLKSKAKHHAVSSRLDKPFHFTTSKPLIVQYEVKFQNALDCGGAYVKLLADDPKPNLEKFFDKTGFSVMFGPDKCGTDSKYHFIVRFKNPITGTYEEKHAKKPQIPDGIFGDAKTHLYTLIVNPDNTFKMFIDQNEVNSGSLLSDMTPPINPPKEIVDSKDTKPETWDDNERIEDPAAVKPDDWDESEPKQIADTTATMPSGWLEDEAEMIDDETAVKPDDWDEATDGEWEAPKLDNPKCANAPGCGKWSPPMVDNPKYKGKWRAPLIANPSYQGVWEPRKIPNPDFFEVSSPFASLTSFSAIGLELWSMTDNIYFDNFIITDDKSVADAFADASWKLKRDLEASGSSSSSDSVVDKLLNTANDKPWMWALYALVVLLPILIVVVFCCGSKSKASKPDAATTEAKKTDAPTADDDDDDEKVDKKEDGGEEEDEPENEASDADAEEAKDDEAAAGGATQTKADLEAKENATTSPKKRRTLRKD